MHEGHGHEHHGLGHRGDHLSAAFTFDIEGLDELEKEWASALDELETDLQNASQTAAEEGIQAAKKSHPYQDRTHKLTDTAEARKRDSGESEMVWPQPYGKYVDEGTSRSRPYPFTPIAAEAAEKALEYGAETYSEKLARKMNE